MKKYVKPSSNKGFKDEIVTKNIDIKPERHYIHSEGYINGDFQKEFDYINTKKCPKAQNLGIETVGIYTISQGILLHASVS